MANLDAMAITTIELGEHVLTVEPTVLRAGAERDRLCTAFRTFWPEVTLYEQRSNRVFPAVALRPVG